MNIHTRPLISADRNAWEALYHGYAQFYQVPMNDTILDTVWAWIMDEKQPFYGIIARHADDDSALGLMHFRAMPSPLRGCHVGFLDDLFVTPSARGGKVLESLYAMLEETAQQQGWPFVRWITAENNYRARNAYDKIAEKTAWVTYQYAVD